MSAVVAPTAARDCFPLNCPMTTISTALNVSCNIPESMSGSAKDISLSMIVPLHISISYLFFFKLQHLLRNKVFASNMPTQFYTLYCVMSSSIVLEVLRILFVCVTGNPRSSNVYSFQFNSFCHPLCGIYRRLPSFSNPE